MVQRIAVAAFVLSFSSLLAQSPSARPAFDSFDVATIKSVPADAKAGRYITMQGVHRFISKDYTLKLLIAAAYELSPETISGGPGWVESDHFDIQAIAPGDVQPTRAEQMAMLRTLLADRFKLTFHRQQKTFSIYELQLAKGGPKLKESTAPADEPSKLISTVYPGKIVLPARNATMHEFASLLQRAVLDRPVVDKTGLSGRYDFDFGWAPDETQFGGDIKPAGPDSAATPFFPAIQEELGLKLVATKGPVDALVVDRAERPSEN
jgi:uncharacterized protein (TIGR03435 family)